MRYKIFYVLIIIVISFLIVLYLIRPRLINPSSVEYIELVQVDHPYLGKRVKSLKLDSSLIKPFLLDFADKREEICKFYSCYVIKIHLKNGQLISYRTNGHAFEKFKDQETQGNYFILNQEINLVSKYWKIPEDMFCKDEGQNNIEDTALENKITDIIFELPEVKKRADYIENETKGKRHLSIWINQTPDKNKEKCYWVKVGEDNGTNLVTHFNFIVSPENLEIKYYDVENDKIISINTWRRKQKNHK
jgi:hypothetical protein